MSLKFELQLEKDQELRDLIKGMIEQQVKTTVREEFQAIIVAEVKRIIAGMYNPTRRIEQMIDIVVRETVNNNELLRKGSYHVSNLINTNLNEVIANKDWSQEISNLATEKIKAMLTKE